MSVGYDQALFALGGDPGAIAASASAWQAFASEAAGAADALRGLDTDDFAGDEADRFRQVLDADLPQRLRTSSQAWSMVGSALGGFGATLDECQQRMRQLGIRAAGAWHDMCCARDDAARQHAAQRAQLSAYRPWSGGPAENSSQPSIPAKPAKPASRSCPSDAQLDDAATELTALMDAARSVRCRHDDAMQACAAQIHHAAGMRFAEPPGWFAGLVSDVGGWIADHAAVLSGISAVLKQISSISGMLAMIPVLAPVMGPISIATGAGAIVVDGAVMAATGRGSWSDLVLEGASMLPGAKAAAAVGTVQTAVAVQDAARGDGGWADVFTTAASVVIGAKGAHGGPSRRSGPDGAAAPARPGTEPGAAVLDGRSDSAITHFDDTTVRPEGTGGYGDTVPTSADPATPAGPGEPDVQLTSHDPADPARLPGNLPSCTEPIYFAARDKVPSEWGPPRPNRDGKGLRWWGSRPDRDRVRIDLANTASPFPSQRVDHVIVHSNGKVLGPDGIPISGAIGTQWQCHIPLTDWLAWQEWNMP